MMTEDDNPLISAGMTTIPQVLAWLYHHEGATGVHQVLKQLLNEPLTTREGLKRDAAKLQQMRLPDVAAIVLEAAEHAPSEFDPTRCPYDVNSPRGKDWLARIERKQRRQQPN
jgi:hypothetical protein